MIRRESGDFMWIGVRSLDRSSTDVGQENTGVLGRSSISPMVLPLLQTDN